MTHLAYMTRKDWAQDATAMVPSSAHIRDWLSPGRYILAMPEVARFGDDPRSVNVETARFLFPNEQPPVVDITDLTQLSGSEHANKFSVVVLHPHAVAACEALGKVIRQDSLGHLFVMVWSPQDAIRTFLDALGAVDLHTNASVPRPDPLQVAAAKLIVKEEYNGLSSGLGKDAAVQLLRAFIASGYALDESSWLRAYFSAGGTFRHSEVLAKYIREMKAGVKHRAKSRYRENIVQILRDQVAKGEEV